MANNALKTYKKASTSSGLRPPKLERPGSGLNRSDMPSSLNRSLRGGIRRKGDDHPARQSSADEVHSMSDRGGESGNASSASAGFGYDFSRVPAHASPQAIQLPNLLPHGPIQATLIINQPGDEYEKEADRVADQVMRVSEARLQRVCAGGGGCPKCRKEQGANEQLQTKPVQEHDTGEAVSPIVQDVISSPGQPLDPETCAFFEPRFGHDFSRVRVHNNSIAQESAKAIQARAFTAGNNIVFGKGQYAPETLTGKKLLAHELTHVVQQSMGFNNASLRTYSLVKESVHDPGIIQRSPDSPYSREQLSAYFQMLDNPWLQDVRGGIHVFSLYQKTAGTMAMRELVAWLNETEGFTQERGRPPKYLILTRESAALLDRYYPGLRETELAPLYAPNRFYSLLHMRQEYVTIEEHGAYYQGLLTESEGLRHALPAYVPEMGGRQVRGLRVVQRLGDQIRAAGVEFNVPSELIGVIIMHESQAMERRAVRGCGESCQAELQGGSASIGIAQLQVAVATQLRQQFPALVSAGTVESDLLNDTQAVRYTAAYLNRLRSQILAYMTEQGVTLSMRQLMDLMAIAYNMGWENLRDRNLNDPSFGATLLDRVDYLQRHNNYLTVTTAFITGTPAYTNG